MNSREHHKTHTWPERNSALLDSLVTILRNRGKCPTTVIDIGPGGIVRWLAPYFPKGDRATLTGAQRLVKSLLTIIESPLRDQEGVELVSYEPEEITKKLQPLGMQHIIVVDKYRKVLQATESAPGRNAVFCDIEKGRICSEGKLLAGDVVVALNVIQRCPHHPAYAVDTVSTAVSRGGYLVTNMPPEMHGRLKAFSTVEEGIYIRD